MSMFRLTLSRAQAPFDQITCHPKRYLHRSPDYRYVEIWKRSNVHFQKHYSNIYFYPSLTTQIIKTSAASKVKGFVPFIHAVPASMSVVRKVWERIAIERGMGFSSHMIRSPLSVYANRSYEEALGTVPIREVKAPKSGILSMSYALTSGSQHLETASSWGFCNHLNDEQYFPFIEELRLSLKHLDIGDDSYFAKKGRYLISQYAQLEVGDFLVIHVPPDLVEGYVFDSYPYNLPTGKSAIDVALNPEKHIGNLLGAPQTHLASMVLCKDVLGMDSQISMTHANNPSEVDQFCSGIQMHPMNRFSVFDELTSPTPTIREQQHIALRKSLDQELDIYADELKTFLEDGERKWSKTFTLSPVYRGLSYIV